MMKDKAELHNKLSLPMRQQSICQPIFTNAKTVDRTQQLNCNFERILTSL
jgi:hypothetical protein